MITVQLIQVFSYERYGVDIHVDDFYDLFRNEKPKWQKKLCIVNLKKFSVPKAKVPSSAS